jgi:5'-nucleotidase (lipoprotein e(P4) family)
MRKNLDYIILSMCAITMYIFGSQNLLNASLDSVSTEKESNNQTKLNRSDHKAFVEQKEALTQQQLNEQSVLGNLWMQQSGEYVALAHQAFNTAKVAFDSAIAQGVKHPAVVVDIDETILDNSAYQAGLIDTNNSFNTSDWNEWVKAKEAIAIPGSVEFVNYVNANGGKIFFVSDRAESSTEDSQNNDLELATIENLQAVGFIDVNDESLLLKGEFSQTIGGKNNISKQFRREAVSKGSADGIAHKIVVLVGDNLNDLDSLAGETNNQRRDRVEANKNQYGVLNAIKENDVVVKPAYIILPNPIYGAWESGLYEPEVFNKKLWFELNPSEKNQQRKNKLTSWTLKSNSYFSPSIQYSK